MKLHKHLLAALLLVSSVALSGCFEEIAGPFDGPDQVGFSQFVFAPAQTNAPAYAITAPEGFGTLELQIELIGPHRSTDLQFPITVVEGSTATTGQYNLPAGTTVTIPANSSYGRLQVNIPPSDLEANVTRTVIFEVGASTNGEVQPAENWKRFTLTIRGV